ncbi:MAG TPA: hypothetical protein DDW45_05535 [Gammaproteobacteria bacterium]|nr:hypothetical protein [Gammaproteobacteria bacterium]
MQTTLFFEGDLPGMPQDKPKVLQEFESYCAEEREHRLNAGGQFDVELYDEAVKLCVRQLIPLLEGGERA